VGRLSPKVKRAVAGVCADNNDISPFGFDLMPIPKADKPDF
jgi:hypothetical protein